MHILKEMNFFIKKVKNIFYFDSCSYCDMFTIMLGYCKKNKVCYNFIITGKGHIEPNTIIACTKRI